MDQALNHEHWMSRAVQLARKGHYTTHPNPRVGCVVVKNGECVAEGFHVRTGSAHAEINALRKLQFDARGCTVYVTLEPCSHHGRTPPCADALIEARPDAVVIAMTDPNPAVAGRGIKRLQQACIEVTVGVLQAEAEKLNPGFIQRMTSKRPWVRLKLGMSLDGRTALSNGKSHWITGSAARKDVQFLRAEAAAILSTAQTVIMDQASLNVRLAADQLGVQGEVRQPLRVILDRRQKLTGKEKLFATDSAILLITVNPAEAYRQRFNADYIRVVEIDINPQGLLDLQALMQLLAEHEINEVLCECGGRLSGALLKTGLVDEICLYTAPLLLGDQAKGLVSLGDLSELDQALSVEFKDIRVVGKDLKITAVPV